MSHVEPPQKIRSPDRARTATGFHPSLIIKSGRSNTEELAPENRDEAKTESFQVELPASLPIAENVVNSDLAHTA